MTRGGKVRYDMVISLGGNCSAAHNLLYRGLRHYSLPFDWVSMSDTRPIEWLAEAFPHGFRDLLTEENLERKKGNAAHSVVYYDKISGFYFPNHFHAEEYSREEYGQVCRTLHRRVERLLKELAASQRVLFLLATSFAYDTACVEKLAHVLAEMYPGKRLDFRVMQFGAPHNGEFVHGNVICNTYSRPTNSDDFHRTNEEWSFLDAIKVPEPPEMRRKKRPWRIVKLLIGLIPLSSLRRRLRKRVRAGHHV